MKLITSSLKRILAVKKTTVTLDRYGKRKPPKEDPLKLKLAPKKPAPKPTLPPKVEKPAPKLPPYAEKVLKLVGVRESVSRVQWYLGNTPISDKEALAASAHKVTSIDLTLAIYKPVPDALKPKWKMELLQGPDLIPFLK